MELEQLNDLLRLMGEMTRKVEEIKRTQLEAQINKEKKKLQKLERMRGFGDSSFTSQNGDSLKSDKEIMDLSIDEPRKSIEERPEEGPKRSLKEKEERSKQLEDLEKHIIDTAEEDHHSHKRETQKPSHGSSSKKKRSPSPHRGRKSRKRYSRSLSRSSRSRSYSSRSPSYSRSRSRSLSSSSSSSLSDQAGEEPPVEYSIYVSDIARGVSERKLKHAFKEIGPVFNATLVRDRHTNENKGFGFVRFYSMADVDKALEMDPLPSFKDKKNGRTQTVKVKLADPKNILFVSNLPKEMKQEEVEKKLNELGQKTITKISLSVDENGESKGQATITYRDHDDALVALKNLTHRSLKDHTLSVYLQQPGEKDKTEIPFGRTLFIKGVHPDLVEEDLVHFFGSEVVEYVTVPLDKDTKNPLGHAFVHFKSRADAEKALDRTDGAKFNNRTLHVSWCLPQQKYRQMQARGFRDRDRDSYGPVKGRGSSHYRRSRDRDGDERDRGRYRPY